MQSLLSVLAVGFLSLTAVTAQDISDADIFNFALQLECLEAQFYSCAAFGRPLPDSLTGAGPAPIGCQKANLTTYQSEAENIAYNEINHVALIRATLGDAAAQCPLVNIGDAFATAANAAANSTLNPPFTPYANDLFFLHGAFIFEDVGVTAYKGAAALIEDKDLLTAAAGVLAVEAYHAGAIRQALLVEQETVLPYGVTVGQFIGAISTLRDTLDNVNGMMGMADQGILYPNGSSLIAPSDANAVAFSRTPAQVLAITYGGTQPGLFFPNGVNGNIRL